MTDPPQRPFGLLANRRHRVDGMEEPVLLLRVLDIGVDQERIGLRMDILHHDLKAIETPRLRQLYLTHEVDRQVLVDNAVTGGEESQHVTDEMPLAVIQLVPMLQIA